MRRWTSSLLLSRSSELVLSRSWLRHSLKPSPALWNISRKNGRLNICAPAMFNMPVVLCSSVQCQRSIFQVFNTLVFCRLHRAALLSSRALCCAGNGPRNIECTSRPVGSPLPVARKLFRSALETLSRVDLCREQFRMPRRCRELLFLYIVLHYTRFCLRTF